jgi:CMP-N,N'-diacetyllegionaminic acid synthase
MSSRVICVIPARGGSKGLPDKNLKRLKGETLVGRAIKAALKSKVIDDVVVTTDSDAIRVEALKCGALVPFMRPAELAGDLTTTEETLRHALLESERVLQRSYDIAVFLSPSDIFRTPEWISEAVQTLKDRVDLESIFVGYRTHKNFWEQDESGNWVRLKKSMALYSSRQIRKPIVREDTGLACASRATLWREGRRIGDKVDIILNDESFTAIDIHDQHDLDLAEAALNIKDYLDDF